MIRSTYRQVELFKNLGKTWTRIWYGPALADRSNDWDDFVDYVAANPMSNQVNYIKLKANIIWEV